MPGALSHRHERIASYRRESRIPLCAGTSCACSSEGLGVSEGCLRAKGFEGVPECSSRFLILFLLFFLPHTRPL